MKVFIPVILVVASFAPVAASGEVYEDVIYLEDGSIIRGVIIEEVPGETYKIEIAGGSVFVFEADEVARIEREPGGPEMGPSAGEYRPISFGANFVFGKYGDYGERFYGAEALVFWRLSAFFSPAVGLGYNRAVYEHYLYKNVTYNIIPVYLSGRFTYLHSGPFGFYADVYGGYGFIYASGTPGESGGFTYGADHGLEFGPPRFRGYVSLGYRRQHHLDRAGSALYVRIGALI
jgi:hypothetical protein